MMKTLTKTELSWIYTALEKQAMENSIISSNAENDMFSRAIANHTMEKLHGTMDKIIAILSSGAKRIEVK